jgi:hypothetical protein
MNDQIRAIIEEAHKLTPGQRLELFDLLRAEFSLEAEGGSNAIEAALLTEVERSISDAASDRTKPVDLTEAVSRVRLLMR